MADFASALLVAQAPITSMGAKLWFLLPEVALLIGACVVVVMGLSPSRRVRDVLPWITCAFLGLGMLLSVWVSASAKGTEILEKNPDMLLMPMLGRYIKMVVCGMGIALTLLTVGMIDRRLDAAVEAGRVRVDAIRANRGDF